MKAGKAIHPSSGGIGVAPDADLTPEGTLIEFDKGANRMRQATMQVIISNLEDISSGNTLEVSFGNGRADAWFTIPHSQTVTIAAVTKNIRVRGTSGATAAYSVMAIV